MNIIGTTSVGEQYQALPEGDMIIGERVYNHPMEPSWKVLKQAVDRKGAKEVAQALRVSLPLLYKWCQEPSSKDQDRSGALNPLDRVKTLMDATGDPEILQWLCREADGFFAKNPQEKKSIDPLQDAQRILKEFSDLLDALSKAVADSHIDPGEAKSIRREWEDVKVQGESLARAYEQSSKRPTPKR